MTSTTSTPHSAQSQSSQADTGSVQTRAKKYRQIAALANQVQLHANGLRLFVRFRQADILEHWVLIIAFVALAFTGLLEKYAGIDLVATLIRLGFGDLSNVRRIHNLAAPILIIMSVYHAFRVVFFWFIKREAGAFMLRGADWGQFFGQIAYNFGLSRVRPAYGRYTIEEKLTYWGTLIFTAVMVITGLIQWFPVQVSQSWSNDVLLWSRTWHSLFTLIAVVLLLPWHLYHTLIRARNASIFTGLMSDEIMRRDHPLEHQAALKAYQEVQEHTRDRQTQSANPPPAAQAEAAAEESKAD